MLRLQLNYLAFECPSVSATFVPWSHTSFWLILLYIDTMSCLRNCDLLIRVQLVVYYFTFELYTVTCFKSFPLIGILNHNNNITNQYCLWSAIENESTLLFRSLLITCHSFAPGTWRRWLGRSQTGRRRFSHAASHIDSWQVVLSLYKTCGDLMWFEYQAHGDSCCLLFMACRQIMRAESLRLSWGVA